MGQGHYLCFASREYGDMSISDRAVEVAVIGGGITGASLLYYLARRGFESVLFERAALAAGPTGVSSANCRLHYVMPELAELARRSFAVMSNFRTVTGFDNGFVRTGVLYGVGPEEASLYKASVARHQASGFPIELVPRSRINAIVPGFDLSGVELAVWEPESGYTDPALTTTGFVMKATQMGAQALTNTEVVRLITDGAKVTSVELRHGGKVNARFVIVAAGPWSQLLLAGVGVDIPLSTERHSVTVLDAPEGSRKVIPCIWEDRPNSYYMRPEGDWTLLIGGPTSWDGPVMNLDAWDQSVTLDESAERLHRAAQRIPRVAHLGIRRAYAGLIDNSPDRLHFIGEVPGIMNLFVIAGSSGHGYKLAPGIAEEFVEHMGKEPSSLLKPFRLDRAFDISANPDVTIRRPPTVAPR